MGGPVIPQGLKVLLFASVGVHLGIIIFITVASSWNSHAATPPKNVITTKLIRLGKQRAQDVLPRLTQPPPPAQKPRPKTNSPAPKAVQKPKSTSATKPKSSSLTSALDRLRNLPTEEAEGDPEGSEAGDALVAALGSKFATEIERCMKRNYQIRGTNKDAAEGFSANILIRVNANGTFKDWKLLKKSGLLALDRAVLRAASLCGKVSPPDARVRREARDGVEVHFQP